MSARVACSRWLWASEPSAAIESASASPAAGPCAIDTATDRLSAAIGDGETLSSTSYSAAICHQSVSSAVAAWACTAAIAASSA